MSLKLKAKATKIMVSVSIEGGGRLLTCDLNAKGMRRCVLAVTELGADGISTILQGRLDGDRSRTRGLSPHRGHLSQTQWRCQ